MDHPTPPSEEKRRKSIWRHSLWFFIILSLILHISGFGPKILDELFPEKVPPKPTPEELAAQLQQEEEVAREKLIEETRNMLRSELEESFESIAADMDQIELEDLWENVEMDIEMDLSALEDMMQQQDYNMEEFAQQYSQLSADMFQSTADKLKDMVRKELKDATLEQVREQTIDKLAQNLDQRMEENVGKSEESRLTRAAANDTNRREREQIMEARKNKQPKPEFNEDEKVEKADVEAREALKFVMQEDISEQIQEEFDKTMEERLAPESAEQILRQANKYFEKFEMAEDEQLQNELLKELAEIVKTEVPERMKEQAAELALNKTEEKLKLEEVEAVEREIEIPEAEKTVAEQMLAQETAPPPAAQTQQAQQPQPAQAQAQQSQQAQQPEKAEQAQETQVAAAPPPPPPPPPPTDPLTEEAADKPKEARQAQVAREVAAASRAAQLGDMSQKMEEIEAKLEMMEKAQLMADFHASGRTDATEMSNLMAMMQGQEGGPKGNMPPGMSLPFSRPLPFSGRGRFNAEVFQKLLEMSQARNNPDAVYADIEAQAEQLVSKAEEFPERRDAMLIDPTPKSDDEPAEEPAETRTLAEPDFKPLKYGFATMVREKPVIDGKIGEDEWPLDRPQYAQWLNKADPVELPEAKAIPMYIQWDPSGLYMAADIPNPERSLPPGSGRLWSGDGIEVWVDTSIARGPLMKYYEAIQMFFAPYGTVEDKNIVAEFGHGYEMRGMPNTRGQYLRGGDESGMQVAMQEREGGYTVEMFMPQGTGVIKGPKFKAGKYLGFQVSFNYVYGPESVSWVLRGHHTWERPDTWGDLLLLGSDAEIAFYEDEAVEKEMTILSPGQPVWIKVHDPDMNLDANYKDQVLANAIGSGGIEQLVVLGETGPNTGVFVGGVNTNSAYAGLVDDSVPVEPGKSLKVIYIDQRRDYGEANKTLEQTIPVAWPTLRFGSNN